MKGVVRSIREGGPWGPTSLSYRLRKLFSSYCQIHRDSFCRSRYEKDMRWFLSISECPLYNLKMPVMLSWNPLQEVTQKNNKSVGLNITRRILCILPHPHLMGRIQLHECTSAITSLFSGSMGDTRSKSAVSPRHPCTVHCAPNAIAPGPFSRQYSTEYR